MSPGDVVYAKVSIYKAPDGESPGGIYCDKGDKLIIRKIDGTFYDYSVSHEDRADGSTFGIKADEISKEPVKNSVTAVPTENKNITIVPSNEIVSKNNSSTITLWAGMSFEIKEENPLKGSDFPFWQFICPCGVKSAFSLNELPTVSTPHPCGVKEHWSIFYSAEEVKKT